jgi:hypothetical protein
MWGDAEMIGESGLGCAVKLGYILLIYLKKYIMIFRDLCWECMNQEFKLIIVNDQRIMI